MDDDGSFDGPANGNASYFLYGAEVLAVRAGEVVALRDGVPDNVPTEQLPPFDPDSAPGNFVVQRLDDARFALYAHLAPGTLTVAVGDRVEQGRVVGRVGNTGNSSEPHLHFHVMDGASPLASDGVPYTFDRFELEARLDLSTSELRRVDARERGSREHRLPMFGDVITFPD
jgi:murein DD-endopeptidase MepM/ murein hydrolase activator NlpD